jgi:hypothetical protein
MSISRERIVSKDVPAGACPYFAIERANKIAIYFGSAPGCDREEIFEKKQLAIGN